MIYLFLHMKYERNNKKPFPDGMFEWWLKGETCDK